MRAVVILLLVAGSSAKVFDRCELARTLKAAGMDGYEGVGLADWVCLANWESGYNTKKFMPKRDGSTNYGIFQINSKLWCHDFKFLWSKNICNINCFDLMSDDIQTTINCAKVMVKGRGINIWEGWRNHCQGQDLTPYLAGCKI